MDHLDLCLITRLRHCVETVTVAGSAPCRMTRGQISRTLLGGGLPGLADWRALKWDGSIFKGGVRRATRPTLLGRYRVRSAERKSQTSWASWDAPRPSRPSSLRFRRTGLFSFGERK